jgi:glyoxylase-like metal-dependent hydrolase (beta-lactamase superfamily II)
MKMMPANPIEARRVTADTLSLTVHLPVPGLGVLPVSAFVIEASDPVIVDAGVVTLREAFLEGFRRAIDLGDVRWIWLTHTDPDHTGCLEALLEAAPRARVVTTFLGMAKMGLHRPLPPERVFLLNPGQALDAGDRRLVALRPPTFDAPETTGLFDTRTRALFSADSFGALLDTPAESARQVAEGALRDGLVTWAGVDAPWLAGTDAGALDRALGAVLDLDAAVVLGSHLPPAPGMAPTLVRHLAEARHAAPFVGPDQAALAAVLRGAA